jgi:hypothetical protein
MKYYNPKIISPQRFKVRVRVRVRIRARVKP